MERESDRTKDSVEQMEEREMPNPITDEDIAVGEAGDALRPDGETADRDKDDLEGPAPHTTQMPR